MNRNRKHFKTAGISALLSASMVFQMGAPMMVQAGNLNEFNISAEQVEAFKSAHPEYVVDDEDGGTTLFSDAAEEAESLYKIDNGAYASRLRNHLGEVELEIVFENQDEKGNKIFNRQISDDFMEKATIEIQNGEIYTWEKAGFENNIVWDGTVNHHVWTSTNQDFIKTFVLAEEFNVKVTDPDGNVAQAVIKNEMSEKDIKELLESSEEDGDVAPEETHEKSETAEEDIRYAINSNAYMTSLKNNSHGSDVNPKLQMAFVEKEDDGSVMFTMQDAENMDNKGSIRINGGKTWTFKEAGFSRPNYGNGTSISSYECKNREFIKTFAAEDTLSVEVLLDGRVVAKGSVPNKMSSEERKTFLHVEGAEGDVKPETVPTPEAKPEKVKNERAFYTVETVMMHSGNGDMNYPYKEPSMAGAVMEDKGEIVQMSDGTYKLVVHFQVAEVMGARAYATGFELKNDKSIPLKENEKGDIPTAFIRKGDDSGILIVDIPEARAGVYEGYVYSNIMSNTAAIRADRFSAKGKVSEGLDTLIKKVETDTKGKKYYDRKAFDEALKEAKKNKTGENYLKLLMAQAGLREKLDNPFADGELFFVPVKGSSAFANPPGTSNYILKPWARVEKKNDKTVITLDFSTYDDWSGKQAVSSVKVYGEDQKTEIPVEFERYDDDMAKLSFEMPYYPESGTFKSVLTDLNGRDWSTDLILDYSEIHKGMRPELIKDAIGQYDAYNKDWLGKEKGRISEDKKEMYAEKSFAEFVKVIKRCEDDLLPENRKDLTQDKIDEDVKMLKEARENLVYKAAAGTGNTVNSGTAGLSNPGNVYSDEGPHMVAASWAGSRILFGGHTYKVLNNGMHYNSETKEDEQTAV